MFAFLGAFWVLWGIGAVIGLLYITIRYLLPFSLLVTMDIARGASNMAGDLGRAIFGGFAEGWRQGAEDNRRRAEACKAAQLAKLKKG